MLRRRGIYRVVFGEVVDRRRPTAMLTVLRIQDLILSIIILAVSRICLSGNTRIARRRSSVNEPASIQI